MVNTDYHYYCYQKQKIEKYTTQKYNIIFLYLAVSCVNLGYKGFY